MRRSLIRVLWPLVPLSLLAFGATALADDPESLTLAVSSTRESCTLGSVTTLAYSIEGGVPPYRVRVDDRGVDDLAAPNFIPCLPSAIWTPLDDVGGDGIQRISVSVSDSTGARAYAIAEVQLVSPLPAPTYLQVTSGMTWSSEVNLSAEWRVPYLPREQRTEDFAIRWRVVGAGEWKPEHHRGDQGPVFSFRSTWKIEAPRTGEQREVQVAQLRHLHDLQVPEALVWSATALVTTAAHPYQLQAEATHDAIALRWGPHARGLAYVARLEAVHGTYRDYEQFRLTEGPLFEARFGDLLPDMLYRVEVRLEQGDRYRSPLARHRFEIRTEQAPPGWVSPSRTPTNVTAKLIDSELQVTWTPPSTGSGHETLVCVSLAEGRWTQGCDTVAAGEAEARIALEPWVTGGMFAITVEPGGISAGLAELDAHAPSYGSDLPTQGAPPDAPQFFRVSWSHRYHQDPKPATWRLGWNHEGADLAEVTWQVHGRRFIREIRRGEFSISLKRTQVPESVRVRLLKEDVWTPWSAAADVSRIDDSYRNVRLVEGRGVVEVHWEPPADDSDLVGYRLYVSRNYQDSEVIDVGRQVSAEIPITPTVESIGVNVATVYDGPLEVVHFFDHWHLLGRQARQPEPLELDVYAYPSMCPPAERGQAEVRWRISGGVRPYTVSIGDLLGFETDRGHGFTIVECRTGPNGLLQDIKVSAMDARGQTTADIVGPDDVDRYAFEDEDPFSITFGPRSVHRDRIWVTWESCRERYVAALRWRVAGTESWSYVLDFPLDHHAYAWRCSGMLDGLAPLTTYEYQLARYISAEQLRQPQHLRWSETQIVTTLGTPQELAVVRDGETVRVSWQRQPEAWAYVVGLRASGRSWWKRYEPRGESSETVYFYRVPGDLELRVELISPPLKRGEEEIPREVDPRWSMGH